MILQVVGAFVAVICFSIILEVPRKYLLHDGFTGAVGMFAYLFALKWNVSVTMSTFISAIIITLISNLLARMGKAPVTIFLIAGILPLVPGAGMYRIVYYILQQDKKLVQFYSWETLMEAGAIAVAIFITDSLYRLAIQKKVVKSE